MPDDSCRVEGVDDGVVTVTAATPCGVIDDDVVRLKSCGDPSPFSDNVAYLQLLGVDDPPSNNQTVYHPRFLVCVWLMVYVSFVLLHLIIIFFLFFLFSLLFENKKLPLKETANVILAEGFFICRMAFMELCGICRTCLRCGIHHSFDGFMIIHQAYHCINMTAFKVTLNDSFSYWRPLFNE